MMVYANDDGDDGDGGDGDGNSNGGGNDAIAAANGDDVNDNDGGNLRTPIGQRQFDDDGGRTMMYVNNDGNDGDDGNEVNDGDDGDDGNGGDGDGNGDSNGDDAATATNSNDVDEDDGGDLRTTIGRRRLDDNDGTTTMRWQWTASDMQNTCKYCTIHPKQQLINVDSLGRRR